MPCAAPLRRTMRSTFAADSADADESKPSPDILLAALRTARLRAEEVVSVGDAVWDVMASTALRIPFIGLECGGTSTSAGRRGRR